MDGFTTVDLQMILDRFIAVDLQIILDRFIVVNLQILPNNGIASYVYIIERRQFFHLPFSYTSILCLVTKIALVYLPFLLIYIS